MVALSIVAKTINLTIKEIESLPVPTEGKRYYIKDSKVRGLLLMVTHKGSKSFAVYKKVNGRPVRVTLGKFPEITVEKARKNAIDVINKLNNGINPTDEKRHIRLETSFSCFFEEQFMKRYSEPHKKSWKYDLDQYRLHLSTLKPKKLSEITRADIERLHSDIGKKSGIYAANHALALIKVVFNKAIEWGWKGNNPASLVRKFKQKTRERFLLPEELPIFFRALDSESNEDMKDYFYICLLTGVRKSNVMAMKWQELSFARKTWTIEETKNGDSHTVNLMPEVIAILRKREQTKHNKWVFQSYISKSGHMEEPKSAWRRVLKRAELLHLLTTIGKKLNWSEQELSNATSDALTSNILLAIKRYREIAKDCNIDVKEIGLGDLRIHDLRRTLGSWQAITGANHYIIGKSLGHKSQEATAIYARLYNDPVRESLERATKAILMAKEVITVNDAAKP